MLVSVAALATLPFVIARPLDDGAFEGGWNLNAFYYPLWDPLVAWGVILAALWAFRSRWNRPSRITDWLARRAYGAFIVHPSALVGAILLLFPSELPAVAKFVLSTLMACALSFAIASALLALPGAKRVLERADPEDLLATRQSSFR